MRLKEVVVAGAALFAASLNGGCRVQDATAKRASQASDSVDVVQSESAMLIGASQGVDDTMSGEQAASQAAVGAKTFYQPSSCLKTTVTFNEVVYELDGCSGPYGLLSVTGTVTVAYERVATGIKHTTTSSGLQVNGATVDIDNVGVFSRSGTVVTVSASTKGMGTGPRGHTFERNGNYDFSWDSASACMALDGTWQTTVETSTWTTDVANFAKCSGECPAAGGSVMWEGPYNYLVVMYDGSSIANWETGKGRMGTVDLLCL